VNVATIGKSGRRRRSWYRRRLRFQRALIAVFFTTLLAAACWQNAARFFPLPSLNGSQLVPESFWGGRNIHKNLAWMAAHSVKPAKSLVRIQDIYPYAVVPGGVKSPDDLRNAAQRDDVVRRHFAHFDYVRAKLERVKEAREVFLSYRIRDTVFWTSKRIRLHPGELLLTDGKITARVRCGNQISDTAKPDVSNEEPAEDVLDQPVAPVDSAPNLAIGPRLAPGLPSGQPVAPKLFAGGFFFPYVPVGVPLPGTCLPDYQLIDGHCHPKRHKVVTPEPETIVLIAFGLALIAWRYRRTLSPGRP